MELTVYRQAWKARPDGTVVYKGEDARPYVDGQLLFVADGLGGAAAIRHQKIKPELFDKEKIMDTLFQGVYEDYNDPRFVEYVTESFYELFAVKDCYTDNVNNIKKSGYFASRIVGAILLHEMLYNEVLRAEHLFPSLQQNKATALRELERYFAKKIKKELGQIAQNANLIYESSYSGLALLGSTLCATIYLEGDTHVEALYLTAGDSRPYAWTEKNGLCQVLEDQEGKDGGMTNYIKANPEDAFEIRCNYMQYEKPCILFNATDGCFDSGYFLSPMGFEKCILETIAGADDINDTARKLTATFVDYGKHDDSSTIAMKVFGFADYTELKESAKRRLQTIQDTYISQLPDLLTKDYTMEYNKCAQAFPEKLATLKQRFEKEDVVKRYCFNAVKMGKYLPYVEAIKKIDEEIAGEKQKIGDARTTIADVVAGNFIRFCPLMERQTDSWTARRMTNKIQGVDARYQYQANDYVAKVQRYQRELDNTVKQLQQLLQQIYATGVPKDFSTYDAVGFGVVEDCERSMKELFVFFDGLQTRKNDAVKKLAQQRKAYEARNKRMAAHFSESTIALCRKVETGSISIENIPILPDDKQRLRDALQQIPKSQKAIQALNSEGKEKALQQATENYWKEKHAEIIEEILISPMVRIPEPLATEASNCMTEAKGQMKELKAKMELQTGIFEAYSTIYNQYMKGAAT